LLRTSTGMQSLYVYDGTGNPTALLTSGAYAAFAYDYDPYGVRTITTDSGGNGTTQNPYGFKAGIQDRVTGWVKFGARWYDPTLGRWTQHDTLDAPLDPKNANRYAFAANDPINNSDPKGLATFIDYAQGCAGGALTDAAIAVGVGAVTGGSALVGKLVFGCAIGILPVLAGDVVAPEQEASVANGLSYIDFLGDVAEVFGALR